MIYPLLYEKVHYAEQYCNQQAIIQKSNCNWIAPGCCQCDSLVSSELSWICHNPGHLDSWWSESPTSTWGHLGASTLITRNCNFDRLTMQDREIVQTSVNYFSVKLDLDRSGPERQMGAYTLIRHSFPKLWKMICS